MTTPTGEVLFGSWLAHTRELQGPRGFDALPVLGDPFNPGSCTTEDLQAYGEARARYFAEHVTALVVELGEASQEIGWKPWGKDRGLNRDAYIGELVDVLHFAANLLVLVPDLTDAELDRRYREKMAINYARVASKTYQGRGADEKCPRCGRSYDDPKTTCSKQGFVRGELQPARCGEGEGP